MGARRKKNRCQPNFRKSVTPDPATSCGPYKPLKETAQRLPLPTGASEPALRSAGARELAEMAHEGADICPLQKAFLGPSCQAHMLDGCASDAGKKALM